jgi:glycosyltransferase involved in cell wall biosynthesis
VLTPFMGLSPELGEPGRDFLLASFSTESIAENINRILSDQALRKNLGQASRMFAANNFDVERSLDQYAIMYKNLVMKR